MSEKHKRIVVTGDVTMDWNLARTRKGKDSTSTWNADDRTRACSQRGGVSLLADLIERVAKQGDDMPAYEVHQTNKSKGAIRPGDTKYHHSYAMWSLNNSDKVWRVTEFLGLDKADEQPDPNTEKDHRCIQNDPDSADVVVLDDAALGFRTTRGSWPKALTGDGSTPWVILKMAKPVAEGPLWDHLIEHHAERLIVLMTADDLRLTEVHISRGLSWERSAQDVYWELTHNTVVSPVLSQCKHVIVSFQTDGAVLYSKDANEENGRCRLIFDPHEIEGTWVRRHPGGMVGYSSCLAASIARQVMLDSKEPNLRQGIQNGLSALRHLHKIGYGGNNHPRPQLAFPAKEIVEELSKDFNHFADEKVEDPVSRLDGDPKPNQTGSSTEFWSLLSGKYSDYLESLARKIVVEGPDGALKGVPVGQFGKLETADRREMESFRGVRNLMVEYCAQPQERPLSIGVFGPPGSGKSFGVKQIAKAMPDSITIKTFNLSQFDGPDDLLDALHQVRDISLAGDIPLIFWDEFDTTLNNKKLGWLRYFLAPMQDGEFQEGQITHPIGRAIFVFAGGTSHSMKNFNNDTSEEDFKEVKGPDFVSRLKGFLDILGPNPNPPQPSTADPYFIIRRAMLFRSLLGVNFPELFEKPKGKGKLNIDTGVLRAYLNISKFKHGARSMEAILSMSRLRNKKRFERSCLPPDNQLELHVDKEEFLMLVQQLEFEGAVLEKMAAAAHKVYCDDLIAKGWKYGKVRDEKKKEHELLVDYDELSDHFKEANRVNVRNIPKKLYMAGYTYRPARSNETPITFPGVDLERLARYEHELWMGDKIKKGFEFGTERIDNKHPDLIDWSKLSEEAKDKDRGLVEGMPKILSAAGYAIVKLGE